jgi:hypothetical protein
MIQLKQITPVFLVVLLLCFGVLQGVQAVVPPPDGGYPGFNTAEGTNALNGLTTGVGNAAVGWFSLFSNTDGSFNTALGAGTLLFNVGNQNTGEGIKNTAIGTAALLLNSTGTDNTAVGAAALLNNTTGVENTASGSDALGNNTTGSFNMATGVFALLANTEGSYNTATGESALQSNTTGNFNTASGFAALTGNTTGSFNTAVGQIAGAGVTTASNVICIGAAGQNVSNSCYIGQIFDQLSPSGTAAFVNLDGKLGTTVSSRRFKDDIKPMDKTSEAILALRPVTFRYKKEFDPTGIAQFGLVAEDVEKVNPDLVVRDKEGKSYSVRYDQVNAMLLNEFLKEHHKVEKLEAALTAVTEHLKEQDSKIQKVSVQVELSKPAAQTVNNQR